MLWGFLSLISLERLMSLYMYLQTDNNASECCSSNITGSHILQLHDNLKNLLESYRDTCAGFITEAAQDILNENFEWNYLDCHLKDMKNNAEDIENCKHALHAFKLLLEDLQKVNSYDVKRALAFVLMILECTSTGQDEFFTTYGRTKLVIWNNFLASLPDGVVDFG